MNLIDANAAHATTTRRRQTDGATDWQADATFEHASGSYRRTPCRAARARIHAQLGLGSRFVVSEAQIPPRQAKEVTREDSRHVRYYF
ncbi:MAG TPA: hypothetical protein VN887_07020 [Candidatus Angelobacter sp.]|nr:hypothetical protein [Candidatus Angelobacter sp.]